MKLWMIAGSLILTSTFAMAIEQEAPPAENWVCYAQGKQSFGGPVGDIWFTVVGYGDSEINAADRAQQNCFSQALQLCMVTNCIKHN